MASLQERPIPAYTIDRLEPVIGPTRTKDLRRLADGARRAVGDRRIWNVSSTAVGGGVAEMLQVLLAYSRGEGIDTRWLVIEGTPAFFAVTKRLHNRLHGSAGDGGPLGPDEQAVYEATSATNAEALAQHVRAGDVVLLHDPQTAGLARPARSLGAHVVWRCHVGTDTHNEHVESAWELLRDHLEPAEAYVFSRHTHVHRWMPEGKVWIIPPSIDPLAPKNQDLDPAVARAIVGRAGLLPGVEGPRPTYRARDGTVREVRGPAAFPRRGSPPDDDTPLVVQVSRWDRLKDMAGVLRAFAAHVPPPNHLALVGPEVEGVADDPEGAAVLAECVDIYDGLPPSAQERIQLVSLPIDDPDENAAMVNAIQRRATVVVQKSFQEGFGLTVAEAMIKARPIVASRIGGIQDQIRHEQEGLLVDDPADLDGFAHAVNRLLGDTPWAAVLGDAARSRALVHFVPDRHLAQYADLFVRLLDDGR